MPVTVKLMERFASMQDTCVQAILEWQDTNENSPYYGGLILPDKGFNEASADVGCIDTLLSCYYYEKSKFYKNEDFLHRAHLFIDIILKEQHSDGSIDLKETNFHDATMIGFLMPGMVHSYRFMEKFSFGSEKEKELQKKLLTFIKRGAQGLLNGGFHTPNHRWVVTAALSLCWSILKDAALREHANKYLAEGIDCDENGEYTERSTGMYNIINNNALFTIATEFDMPELYEHIKRNLAMMVCYFEPDGTVFTLNSTRQDRSTAPFPMGYYGTYLNMYSLTKDPEYAHMIIKIADRKEGAYKVATSTYDRYKTVGFASISRFMMEPELAEFTVTPKELPTTYHRFFKESGIVRSRKENTSYTVLANSQIPFVYQKGKNQVLMRFGSSFFAKGQFASPEIIENEKGYLLNFHSFGEYKRPFETPPSTSVWREMDHTARDCVNCVDLEMQVQVEEHSDHSVSLHFSSKKVPYLPAKIEFSFLSGGRYESADSVILQTASNSTMILKGKEASYTYHADTLTIQNGRMEHTYTTNMRGTPSAHGEAFTVYLTAMGEFEHTVLIK